MSKKEGENENEWLFHEIIRSLPKEVIEAAKVRKEFNVQLMIDNIVVEPELLNDLLQNINKYIEDVADHKLKEKFKDLELRFNDVMEPLEDATKEATSRIREEFNIEEDEE